MSSTPEPLALDEPAAAEAARLSAVEREAVLRPAVYSGQDCSTCTFYLEEAAPLSFCWHPRVQVLVDRGWWCQWWEERDE